MEAAEGQARVARADARRDRRAGDGEVQEVPPVGPRGELGALVQYQEPEHPILEKFIEDQQEMGDEDDVFLRGI